MSKERMQFCWYCGAELGVYAAIPSDRDTCGKIECSREAYRDALDERDEAHEQLDRDMGWP